MKKLYSTVLFCLLLLVTIGLKPTPVKAQIAKGFTVIPPRFELFGNPGDTLTESVRVRNDSDTTLTYNVVVEDFSTAGEEGHVVLEENSQNTSYTLAKWITLSQDTITLDPNQESSFTFKVVIPKDAEPGGHYASVLFSSSGEAVPGAASVTERVGTLILLRVSGNVTEKGSIETFSAPSNSQTGPIDFTLRLKNDGNVHIQPKGTIVITNMFGRKVDEIPLNGANVLPGATRKMVTTWNKKNVIGSFTATLVATYGQQNLPLTSAARFTVISTTAAVLLGVGVLALFIILISIITGRKRLGRALKVLTSGH